MKTTTASIAALAAIPLLASVGIATADTSTSLTMKTNDNNHRALSSRHWATLIPPSRVAALLFDDAHIHAPPSSSSNNNHASSTAESLIDVPSNPNPASPHSISSQLETAHDVAVSAAIQAGASITQIENLAYGGGVVSAATILDASAGPGGDSYHPANRLANPALEYSPHIFDLAPSRTQPWITSGELDKFVGGAQNLRPDINEWLDVVLPEAVEDAIDGEGGKGYDGQDDSDQVTLDEILHSNGFSGFTNPIAPVNTPTVTTNTNANSNFNNQGAAAATGGYTIDPVTGVYLDANGMVIADPSSVGIANTNNINPVTPAVAPTAASIGSIIFPSPTGGATTTTTTGPPPAVSTASNLADLKKPSSYPDPTIQGGVQLQYTNILPYPLSLPWYPRDGRPWVDPADLPAISGKAPVLDAINAASSVDVKRFIRNAYWDTGYWTEDNFFGYGPPCSVAEVVAYNERMRAQGRLDGAVQMTGKVGKNGKINGGPFIPGLHVVSADVARGSLGRCEGDCDGGELFDVRDEFNSFAFGWSGTRVRGGYSITFRHI